MLLVPPSHCLFFCRIFLLFGCALRHVESRSLIRDRTHTPCSGSPVLTTGPPGKSPTHCLLLEHQGRSSCRRNLRGHGGKALAKAECFCSRPENGPVPSVRPKLLVGKGVSTPEPGPGTPEPRGCRGRQGTPFLKCSSREQRTASPTSGS